MEQTLNGTFDLNDTLSNRTFTGVADGVSPTSDRVSSAYESLSDTEAEEVCVWTTFYINLVNKFFFCRFMKI